MDKQVRWFWIAVSMLALVAATMVMSSTTILDAADDVDHDIARVDAWNSLDTAVVEVDQAATDYLFTGDPEALQAFHRAEIGLMAARFDVAASGAPAQPDLIAALERHRVGVDAAVALGVTDRSSPVLIAMRRDQRALVSELRGLIADLDDHVHAREGEREKTAKAALIERIAQLVGLGMSLAIAILAFVGLRRQARERRQMTELLQSLNGDLELRVAQRTAELVTANERLQREIEERRRTSDNLRATEEQLRQSQKLEGIGQLAGGVAHDFNNLLTVIISYAEMLTDEIEAPSQRADINEIRLAAVRAADLTRQLLAFSRRQVLAPKVVDLNNIVDGMGKLLHRVIGEHIDLRVVRGATSKVEVDPGQIEQVIMNLVVNARDAMPRGGSLTIETTDVLLDDEYASQHAGVIAGPHVMLAISDTGSGMSPEIQARIFEPFFTTKDVGKGTGLGLATVFGIVKQSRGSIWVYSEIDAGTVFKVYIPVASQAPTRLSAPSFHAGALGGREQILLVEDDASVRKLASTMLKRAGYSVVEAYDGQNALALWEKLADTIDLVVTDVVMPKMGGRVLGETLARSRPDLPVIYMSGYTDDTVMRHGIIEEAVTFVQKPLAKDALLKSVRAVLDRRSAAMPS